jgi:hypothetical protein
MNESHALRLSLLMLHFQSTLFLYFNLPLQEDGN